MKIHIMSDLHLEFGQLRGYHAPDCDVVILAGDIGTGTTGVRWINATFPHSPVATLAGNHEFYRNSFPALYSELRLICLPNVHFLQNSIWEHEGQRFLGGTLWTDFKGNDPFVKVYAQAHMSDYSVIEGATPDVIYEDFLNTLTFLQRNIQEGDVVVTHHAPSYKSVDFNRYTDRSMDPLYCSDLSELIVKTKPRLWIHGHTHASKDYTLGDTRVICNPRGYSGHQLNPDFDPTLVAEI